MSARSARFRACRLTGHLYNLKAKPPADLMEIPKKLREYLDARGPGGVPITNPDQPLGLDSLDLIRLVQFMENDLGIHLEDYELVAKNFVSLRALGALLESKRSESKL